MNIHAITSWGTDCGIAEYAKHLRTACDDQHLNIRFRMDAQALDPQAFFYALRDHPAVDVVWLNFHAGLHSRWTAAHLQTLQREYQLPVVVTYHDTYDGLQTPNSEACRRLFRAADAFVVHEPVADLPGALVLRQGIPDLQGAMARDWRIGGGWERPTLGTVGFPFPWKNYDRLAETAAAAGWGILLLAPRATPEDVLRWQTLNPWAEIYPDFLSAAEVVSRLASCTATAFMYECYNTGTSGAIRQGIAARKPVYALQTCRQFRDLLIAERNEEAQPLIRWVESWAHLAVRLKTDPLLPWDAGMVYLAERDSWHRHARTYMDLFEAVLSHTRVAREPQTS
jgi:glycosyltransferase involved in cell wall biosynthesis